jgi:glutamyl-tRNA synthetase
MTVHIPIPENRPVRVRIAPSPTGDPHVGTAYIGLFNMVFARKHGGRFVLRVEDTDQTRSTRESEEAIYRSLRWVGLQWDEGPDVGGEFGPYRQSERTAIYRTHAEQLVASGHAYRCFATAEELAEMREHARAEKLPRSYDRRYRDLSDDEIRQRLDAGEAHVIRLKMPVDGETVFTDGLRGEVCFDNGQIDDQVLLKSDGFPTYHLANVVDDHLMEITHVIRAEEWISSTPKHVQLYEAFGWQAPVFIHMPLLRNQDKSKISKRKNPVSLQYYEHTGILPEALLNYLGRMGWSIDDETEKFSLEEMVEVFTFERMRLGGPVFDLEKLDWLNGLYLRELSSAQVVDRLKGWLLSRDYLERLVPLVQQRITRLDQFVPMTTYFFGEEPPPDPESLIPKNQDRKTTYKVVKALTEAIDALRTWDEAHIETCLKAQVQESGWKLRDVFMTVRLIVTGRKATPGMYETMALLGKARCQARLRAAMKVLR